MNFYPNEFLIPCKSRLQNLRPNKFRQIPLFGLFCKIIPATEIHSRQFLPVSLPELFTSYLLSFHLALRPNYQTNIF